MEPHVPTLFDAIASHRPTAAAIRTRNHTTTWADLASRTDALAAALVATGIGRRSTADDGPAQPWECPNPRVALYLHNHPAYLEAMVGAWKAGATAMNVNYRYRATELVDLLNDGTPEAIVYHRCFTPTLHEVLTRLQIVPRLLVCVPDESDHDLLPGAILYEDLLRAAGPLDNEVRRQWSHEDRYLVYTGGTTGTPKGVLWRQSDFAVSALGFAPAALSRGVTEWARRLPPDGPATLPAPPFMHGAAHWNALAAWLKGGTVVLPEHPERFDPDAVLDAVEWGAASALIIVGDAFARPLLEADRGRHRELASLRHLLTGGATLSPAVKAQLIERWPHLTVVDVLGSSESGRQAVHRHRAVTAVHRHRAVTAVHRHRAVTAVHRHRAVTAREAVPDARVFQPDDATVILNESVSAIIEPPAAGEQSEVGWLARRGRVPLGYLGHPQRTAATFPVLDGQHLAVTGDRARYTLAGDDQLRVELLGRESACINTGGEKVFAEEVEVCLARHPAVVDLLVAPAVDEQFGQAVGVVAALRPGASVNLDDLRQFGRLSLADYKLPRRLVVVDEVVRSPSGKPDYRWARGQLDR